MFANILKNLYLMIRMSVSRSYSLEFLPDDKNDVEFLPDDKNEGIAHILWSYIVLCMRVRNLCH